MNEWIHTNAIIRTSTSATVHTGKVRNDGESGGLKRNLPDGLYLNIQNGLLINVKDKRAIGCRVYKDEDYTLLEMNCVAILIKDALQPDAPLVNKFFAMHGTGKQDMYLLVPIEE